MEKLFYLFIVIIFALFIFLININKRRKKIDIHKENNIDVTETLYEVTEDFKDDYTDSKFTLVKNIIVVHSKEIIS